MPVLTSCGLKQPLIDAVVDHAAAIRITLDQRPQIRVETALPRFFATVADSPESPASPHTTNTSENLSPGTKRTTGRRLPHRRAIRTPRPTAQHMTSNHHGISGYLNDPFVAATIARFLHTESALCERPHEILFLSTESAVRL